MVPGILVGVVVPLALVNRFEYYWKVLLELDPLRVALQASVVGKL